MGFKIIDHVRQKPDFWMVCSQFKGGPIPWPRRGSVGHAYFLRHSCQAARLQLFVYHRQIRVGYLYRFETHQQDVEGDLDLRMAGPIAAKGKYRIKQVWLSRVYFLGQAFSLDQVRLAHPDQGTCQYFLGDDWQGAIVPLQGASQTDCSSHGFVKRSGAASLSFGHHLRSLCQHRLVELFRPCPQP